MSGDAENGIEFVSQEEIDRLLNEGSASSEDGTPSAEPTVSEAGADLGVEGEPFDGKPQDEPAADETSEAESSEDADLDQLLDAAADSDASAVEAPIDRVILEEVPEAESRQTSPGRQIWALQKDFWITLSVVFLLGAGVNLLLWFHSTRSHHVFKPEILSFPVVNTVSETAPLTFRDDPRSITLKGFIVPAPMQRKDLTYITADVSIELTHSKAVSLIKAHAPFYRNIIYEVIRGILNSSLDKTKINEIGLKIEILKALNGSVPERSIRDVSVDTFVMF